MAGTPLLRPSLFRTLFFVAIASVALVLIDSVLAGTERRETALEAARFYHDGRQMMQQHRYANAADAFRSAIANARGNMEYPLALAQALLAAGQLDDADATLTDLLQSDSMAGAPNLAMARVFAKKGLYEDAEFYYHRAIYGQWKADAQNNRVKTRFELADLLAARDSKPELLAELLPLQDQASNDAATQAKLARLYMIAGSPARAAAIFRDLVRLNPRDTAAEEGLGNAEFALGNYPEAQSALVAAVRLSAGDQSARKALELCDQVLNLDPMRHGLDNPERYRRSVHVLELVVDKVTQCLAPDQDLMDAANKSLARHFGTTGQSEAVEANLDLAAKLWQAEKTKCASAISAMDEPLQLVLAKATQKAN
jgi:tetratricopeptide (TPR) repeat protein